jgi:hypothetical protein
MQNSEESEESPLNVEYIYRGEKDGRVYIFIIL